MKTRLILILLISIILFSSCNFGIIRGGGSGDNTGTPEEDITGDGLDINFNINDKDKNFGILEFTVDFKNSGKEPITLTRENFILSTTIKDATGSNVLTQDSIDNFYKTALGDDESLTLIQNQEKGTKSDEKLKGPLVIDENFFKQNYNEEIEILLHANYDYTTTFDNNIQIDFKYDNLMRLLDGSPSQAAPVQITDINIGRIPADEYIIIYTIRDKGNFGDSVGDRVVNINEIDFKFRGESLNDCKAKTKDKYFEYSSGDSLQLNKETMIVDVECRIDLDEFDKSSPTNVKTSGSFSYNYEINQRETIKLPRPEDRSASTAWDQSQ